MKTLYGFYNEDGEQEVTMELDSKQEELLTFLQDWGFLCDSIKVQDLGEIRKYPAYAQCPVCGKTCVLLNGIGAEAEFWCDDCGLDFTVEVEE